MRYDGRWRESPRPLRRRPRGREARRALQGAASRARPWSRTRCRPGSCGRTRSSTTSSCCARTATPTYMLAVVVDDHDMGVTHVVRGDDHLTKRRAPVADLPSAGLGRAGDGAHPAHPRLGRLEAVEATRGASASIPTARWATLPEALRNYPRPPGAGRTATRKVFSTQEMIAAFDLGSIGRSAARLRLSSSLEALNGHYMRQRPPTRALRFGAGHDHARDQAPPSAGLGTEPRPRAEA